MRKLLLLIILSISINSFSQETIYMKKEGGVYTIPCEVNGLRLKFIFDTGASDVSISLSEALFMLKNDYLSEYDIKGSSYYQIANGEVVEGTTINLRKLKIGSKILYNVEASIVHSMSSPLLLGQSALSKMGKFSFDYSNNTLVFGSNTNSYSVDKTPTYKSYDDSNSRVLTTTTKSEGKLRTNDVPVSNVIKYIPKGATVRVLENKGSYWKIFYDGKTGYINEMYLSVTYSMSQLKDTQSPSATTSNYTSSEKYNNYEQTTTKSQGKLRTSDVPVSNVIKYIPKSATVRVLENKGGYWKIFYDGKTGYINEMYLNITYKMTLMKNK